MVSKLLICSALAVTAILVVDAAKPCPDGAENEVQCGRFCSDRLCVYSPQIQGFKKIVTSSRAVKIARDSAGGASTSSHCSCKAGMFRKSVGGPCVTQCGKDEVPVNTNVLNEVENLVSPPPPFAYPFPPPVGPYPGAGEGGQAPPYPYPYPYPYGYPAAPIQEAPPTEPPVRRELIGSISHVDDSKEIQRDTMLANGMTVEQLAKLKSFFRLYNEGTADHFYTWVEDQITSAIKDHGYRMEGISGKVATAKADITGQGITCDRLKALTQFFKGGALADPDHFYTVKAADAERAVSEGYAEEGIAAYCVDYAPGCGATIPLHRFWSEGAKDHIYITRYKDFNSLSSDGAWTYEGVECYIWPSI